MHLKKMSSSGNHAYEVAWDAQLVGHTFGMTASSILECQVSAIHAYLQSYGNALDAKMIKDATQSPTIQDTLSLKVNADITRDTKQ